HDRADDPAGDAAVIQREIFRRVEWSLTEAAAVARRRALLRLGGEGRCVAVFRLDHQRCLSIRLGLPRLLLAEDADRVLATLTAVLIGLLRRRELLVVEHRACAELLGPFARNAERRVARPYAGDVRVAPFRLRLNEPFGRGGQLRRDGLDVGW